jgi:CheY-like chemotaxis protein
MNIKPLNILLADDDKDDRLFFSMALEALTIPTKLATVGDGEKLMAYLSENTLQLPDVIFLDLKMPRKNGFECLLEIKLNQKLSQLPVIIFSTSFEQEVVNMLYKNGAKYFIRKPFEFLQFKKIIQQTFTLISQENMQKPSRENFVLTVQSSQSFLVMPGGQRHLSFKSCKLEEGGVLLITTGSANSS